MNNKDQISFDFDGEKKEHDVVDALKDSMGAVEVPYSDEELKDDQKRQAFSKKSREYMNTYPDIKEKK